MPTLKEQIDEARKSGYSDAQITQHIQGKYLPSKIQEAKEAGYSEQEISAKVNQVLSDSKIGDKSLGQRALGIAKKIALEPIPGAVGRGLVRLQRGVGDVAAAITPQVTIPVGREIRRALPILPLGQVIPKELIPEGPEITSKGFARFVGESLVPTTPLEVGASLLALGGAAKGLKFIPGKGKLPMAKNMVVELSMGQRKTLTAELEAARSLKKTIATKALPGLRKENEILGKKMLKLKDEPLEKAEKVFQIRANRINEVEQKLSQTNLKQRELESVLAGPKGQAVIQSQPIPISKEKVDSVVALGDAQPWKERVSDSANLLARNFGIPGTQLRKMGTMGQIMDRKIVRSTLAAEQRKANLMTTMNGYFDKMNQAEIQNFVDVMDGKGNPLTSLVKNASVFTRKALNQVAKDVQGLKLQVRTMTEDGKIIKREWKPIQNYFPSYYDQQIKNMDSFRNVVVQKIMRRDKLTMVKAQAKFESMMRRRIEPVAGSLEKARQYDIPGYIRDPRYVFDRYFRSAFKRIEFAKSFGKEGEIGDKIIAGIESGSNRNLAKTIFDSEFRGQLPSLKEIESGGAANWIKDKVTISMMGASHLNNALQGVFGSYVRFGMRNSLKGLWTAATKFSKSKEAAQRSGALMDDIFREIGTTMKSRQFLEKSGFSATERFNRIVADASARHYADELLVNLKRFKGKPSGLLDRELKSFGINRKAVEARGYFKPNEINSIAKISSDLSQGRASKYDVPLFFQSPSGQVAFQFSNFGLSWGKFINQFVVREAKKGNIAPALRLIAGGAVAGELPNDVKAMLFGKKRKAIDREHLIKSLGKRGLENLATVGGLGIAMDLFYKGSQGIPVTTPAASLGAEAGRTLRDVVTMRIFSNEHRERQKAATFLFNRALPHEI